VSCDPHHKAAALPELVVGGVDQPCGTRLRGVWEHGGLIPENTAAVLNSLLLLFAQDVPAPHVTVVISRDLVFREAQETGQQLRFCTDMVLRLVISIRNGFGTALQLSTIRTGQDAEGLDDASTGH